jgi:hypothetical protein
MLFGNRQRLALEIRPLAPTWERRYAPEQTAWAALAVWAGGCNLCAHSESGDDRMHDALNVPLAPLADWLVRSWPYIAFEERAALVVVRGGLHDTHLRWGAAPPAAGVSEDTWYDQRAEWWQRHFLRAGADGALLPDLALLREDERLVLEWRRPPYTDLTLLEREGSHAVAWAEAREVVTGFVGWVADWLRREGLGAIYAWLSDTDPLQAQALPWFERLELYTGRSRTEIAAMLGARDDDDLVRRLGLVPPSDDPAGSPVTQALRDLPPRLPVETGRILLKLGETTRRAGVAPALDRLRGVALDASRDAATPEEAGYFAARALRADLRMDGNPVPEDVGEFLGFLDVDLEISPQRAPATRMLMGRRDGGRGVAIVLESPRTRVKWGRRFEAARALGHALLDPVREGVIGAASGSFAQDVRRRRSGAFAAELLLPKDVLERASDGALDGGADPDVFKRLMDAYGVGARTTAHQLYNHRLLSSSEIRDQLIDDHAAR